MWLNIYQNASRDNDSRYNTTALQHTATPDDIQAALHALPSMRDADGNPITVVAQRALNGGVTCTFVYTSDNALDADDRIEFVNLNGDNIRGDTVRTTRGSEGWISGGANTFEVTVYALMYKKVRVKHGHIEIKDVMT